MASSFKHLRDFIVKHMRMSHIYQPVMIKELLRRGCEASIREIAAAFLARDESQLEYYEKITKDMPGFCRGTTRHKPSLIEWLRSAGTIPTRKTPGWCSWYSGREHPFQGGRIVDAFRH